jgi:chitin synthase
MIVITMYNEDMQEFRDSMKGIIKALGELVIAGIHPEEVTIFLVADGYSPLKKVFLDQMHEFGFYDESKVDSSKYFLQDDKGKRDFQSTLKFTPYEKSLEPIGNVCHLFQLADCQNSLGNSFPNPITPYNMFFAIKHLNGGKLDSHFWFFKGFAQYLEPNYCFLVDIGTQPLENSLSVLFDYLETHPFCGGVCGEIEVDIDDTLSYYDPAFWVVATQFVEYKISHFLDKAFESFFGFVSVLPGAFSCYRWSSIKGEPLTQYFKGLDKENLTAFQANMYLAEDRIMCLSIVTNPEKNDTLTYIPGAVAITDPPKSLSVLIKQRRRWINGSNFASFFVLGNFGAVWNAKHSFTRKCIFTLLFIYQIFLSGLTFVLIGSGYATFSIFSEATFPVTDFYNLSNIIEYIYVGLLLLILIWSLCKSVDSSDIFYGIVAILMGCLMGYMSYTTYAYFFGNFSVLDSTLVTSYTFWLVGLLILSVVLPVILNLGRVNRVFVFIFGYISYAFLSPFYMNVFVIFSFCNTHDVSWGNRPESLSVTGEGGLDRAEKARIKAQKESDYKAFRTYMLVFWILANVLLAILITQQSRASGNNGSNVFVLVFTGYIVMIISLKLVFSTMYAFQSYWCMNCCRTRLMQIPTIQYINAPKKPVSIKSAITSMNMYRDFRI